MIFFPILKFPLLFILHFFSCIKIVVFTSKPRINSMFGREGLQFISYLFHIICPYEIEIFPRNSNYCLLQNLELKFLLIFLIVISVFTLKSCYIILLKFLLFNFYSWHVIILLDLIFSLFN